MKIDLKKYLLYSSVFAIFTEAFFIHFIIDWKLLYLIIASASAFHFSKSYASKLPGLDSILSSNPGLLNKIINGNK